jgi:hypothetical protein
MQILWEYKTKIQQKKWNAPFFFFILATKFNVRGVTFDDTEKMFVFDFEHDGAEDIVSLTGSGYQVDAFGKCTYYGYEFSPIVDGKF